MSVTVSSADRKTAPCWGLWLAQWCLETTGLGTVGALRDRAVPLPAAVDSTRILPEKIIFRELLVFQQHWGLADNCHHSTDDKP